MVLLVVLCFLILLFGVFITTPLEIGIEINKTANKNKIYVYLRIFGAPVKIKLKQKQKRQKHLSEKKQDTQLAFNNFKENVSAFKEIYSVSKDELKKMLSYVNKHLTINSVDFSIRFGFDNAAATGISTGAIWGMGSFILKVFDSLIGIKKINMQVNPDFDNKIFEIYLKTILIIRPIHLIIMLGQVLKTYKYVNNKIKNIKGGA